ncbi:protein kinase domain-containing protein [Clostridium disporicum]|uniref:protein kinase domain-containing protein n=1 Tax=Clostridium disporicum TaxID=84024 RepID=UPI0034A199A3
MELYIVNNDYQTDLLAIDDIMENQDYSEVLDFVGEGYSSTVYAYDDLAVKVFNDKKELMMDDYFSNEDYKVLEKLQNSPYFQTLYAYKPNKYMVMEFVEGISLKNLDEELEKGSINLNVLEFRNHYTKQIKEILEFCKSQMIIPKDLHAGNIIIKDNGDIKIIDVGLFYEYTLDDVIGKDLEIKKNWIDEKFENLFNDLLYLLVKQRIITMNSYLSFKKELDVISDKLLA